jgi:hypothetical protein
MIKFTAVPVTLDAAAGEDAPRTITGIAVPWDTVATVSGGEKVMFKRGAFDLDAKPARLLENHDGRPIGIVSELVDLDNGLGFSATFSKSQAASDVVELILMNAYDSVSVGAVPKKFKYDKNGVMIVSSAILSELSVVADRYLLDFIDKNRAFFTQRFDDKFIVNDFVANINGRAEFFDGFFDGFNGASNSGTKSAWFCKNNFHNF